MNIFGKFFSSLLIGTGLGVGPYSVAVAAGGSPSTQEIKEEKEDSGFGEECLLDEELCAEMKDEKWEEDEEENGTASGGEQDNGDSILSPRTDDYCSWGFFDDEFNTLMQCTGEKKNKAESK